MTTRNIKYLDEPYSEENYIKLMELILSNGYQTEPFTIEQIKGKTVFLRHDIDYSPAIAERLAKINSTLGVQGTFFFQIRCPLYNLFSFETLKIIQRIIDYGQHIAFHLTLPPKEVEVKNLQTFLNNDYLTFKTFVPECQPVFAWHNTGVLSDTGAKFIDKDFNGFINAYGKFAGGVYPYYADSNMRYSVKELRTIIKKGEEVLQLNLHPMQWVHNKNNMLSAMAGTFADKIREIEAAFIVNSIYKAIYPNGISSDIIDAFEKKVASSFDEEEER